MAQSAEGILFSASLIAYALAAVIGLVLIRQQRACTITANALCILAALLGGASSILLISVPTTQLSLTLYQANLPFLTLGIHIDALSAYFVLALSILVICVSLYSVGFMRHYIGKRNVGLFTFLYGTFILSMVLVFTASNAVFFYIAWEAMALLSYFLVIFESEKKESHTAGTLYLIMTHIAAAFLLIGFLLMYSYTKSFDIFGSAALIPDGIKNVLFILFLLGFGTKAGIIPLHIWLPQAYPAAPSNISALMSGIMIKTAIYGLLRFILCYLGVQHTWWGMALLILGAVSAVLGVAYSLMESNIKRLLAFCSVENIGIILMGLGICFIAQAQQNPFLGALALTAVLLHAVNHTLTKGGLFLGAGAVQYATGTVDMEQLGGLIKKMPVTALLVLCFSLAISALVPFNGFVSEWLTLQSLFAAITAGHAVLNLTAILAVAALGMAGALAVACFVKLFGISFLGLPRSDKARDAVEVPRTMLISMGLLAALCLVIGLFPFAVLSFLDKLVTQVLGTSISDQLRGDGLIPYFSAAMSGSGITPLEIAVGVALLVLLSLLALRLIGGKYIIRRYGTWDCGFEALTARMQYTGTGFSKPIKIVFAALFRPTRQTVMTGTHKYQPQKIEYKTSSYSLFEKKVYGPLASAVQQLSKRLKFTVQTGSIHGYLLYILVLVLLLMAYNKLF